MVNSTSVDNNQCCYLWLLLARFELDKLGRTVLTKSQTFLAVVLAEFTLWSIDCSHFDHAPFCQTTSILPPQYYQSMRHFFFSLTNCAFLCISTLALSFLKSNVYVLCFTSCLMLGYSHCCLLYVLLIPYFIHIFICTYIF